MAKKWSPKKSKITRASLQLPTPSARASQSTIVAIAATGHNLLKLIRAAQTVERSFVVVALLDMLIEPETSRFLPIFG